MHFTTIYVIKQDSQCCQKDMTNVMRIFLDQLCQLLNNFASYCIAMPTPEDKPSKNSTSELGQHEPAQKKKPPDDEKIPMKKTVEPRLEAIHVNPASCPVQVLSHVWTCRKIERLPPTGNAQR